MITIQRTTSVNADFQQLVTALDKDLAFRDGEDHAFFAQFNATNTIKHAVVAHDDGAAVGCGAIRAYEGAVMEVKRMFVQPGCRGKGIASVMLKELESWAKELQATRLILETSIRQPEAIALYKKNSYTVIPNYGQYAEIESSVCFEKGV